MPASDANKNTHHCQNAAGAARSYEVIALYGKRKIKQKNATH
jgi:hypothetical protein